MMNMIKRVTVLFLMAVLLLTGLAFAEDGEAVTEKDGWHFDAKGFLTGEGFPSGSGSPALTSTWRFISTVSCRQN